MADQSTSTDLHAPIRPPWHSRAPEAVLAELGVDDRGLTAAQATESRARHGANSLPPPARDSLALVFLKQFRSPLIYLLLAAGGVSVALGNLSDAFFILGVLLLNAAVGAIQERRAASSAIALIRMAHSSATVLRDGLRERLESEELVVGDILDLDSGMKVPADIRLLTDRDLQIDESLLTGESRPVFKQAHAEVDVRASLGDRKTMAFAGTTVLSGRATGVVTAVGLSTELGAIAAVVAVTTSAPLIRKLNRLGQQIGLMMIGAIVALSVVQWIGGTAPAQIFLVAVALAVAAIPEGLPVAITVAMSVSMTRMARRNVIVRALPAVEGLGACTLIASDKTGTLTCNELTVKQLWLPEVGRLDVGGEGYSPAGSVTRDGAPLDPDATAGLRTLAESGALCNEAYLYVTGDDVRHLGDTVDVAFLVLGAKAGLDRETLLAAHPAVAQIPYEPARRFAAAFHGEPSGGARVHVKGAAETVLPMCSLPDGEARLLAVADEMAHQGYRVLAVASGPVDADIAATAGEAALVGLRFLGFVGLIDPLRPTAAAAVEACRASGIDVRMVTGDHAATALAIARDLGLAHEPEQVLTGRELADAMAAAGGAYDDEIREKVGRATIFARVDAVQKLHIVEMLQQLGHVVAVTGDGANDAPALNAADIGVALGRQGTDVARGAADLVISDDDFSSIVAGIEEGRIAYDNVRKVTMLLIGTGIGEIVLFVLALAVGLPIPLFAVQLLWLNLVTNGVQDIALAFERGEPGILKRAPRPPSQAIFDRRMIVQTALAGSYIGIAGFAFFLWAIKSGVPEDQARAALLLLFVLFENVHVFNCRSETRSAARISLSANPWVGLAVLLALFLQVGAMHWGPSAALLGVMPVDFGLLAVILPTAAGLVLVMELYKRLARAGSSPGPLIKGNIP